MHSLRALYPPPRDPAAFRAYDEATPFGLRGPGQDSPYFCMFKAVFAGAMAAEVAHDATGGATAPHFAVLTASL